MATLKCLACGHDNKIGDESCASCSSSLNLRLCSACEAINANCAERCHSCNADFRVEAEVASLLEADVRPRGGEAQEAPYGKALPAAWRIAAEQARKPSRKSVSALSLLPLLAAGVAYYAYAVFQESPKPEAVSGKIAPAKTAPAPLAKSAPVPEPKTATAVTHTRAGAPEAAARTTAAALPAAAAAPVRAASAPSAPKGAPEARRSPVTHTKAALTEAALAAPAPAAASEGPTVRAETRAEEPAECVPAVAALGLCKSK